MRTRIVVRLKIFSGNRTASEMAALIGMDFDETWGLGDLVPKTLLKRKDNGGVLNSSLAPDASLDEHVENLLRRVRPVANRIFELSRTAGVEFSCVIYSSERVALFFRNEILGRICALGADFDVDYYALPEGGDDPNAVSL